VIFQNPSIHEEHEASRNSGIASPASLRGLRGCFLWSLHVALRRQETMKIAARGQGKLAVCLDAFNAVFLEN
jgi:hypothetical protein